jgi:Type VI secretion system/phage-baseplate injector OB domain
LTVEDLASQEKHPGKRYYGKYRGKVVSPLDPMRKGRILVMVPSVSQVIPIWAEPCVPFAGLGVGTFFVPPINASVWIEFEEGNPRYPIWTGGYWDEKDLAPIQPNPFSKPGDFIIRTLTGNTIKLSDVPPGITLETIDQKKVSLGIDGIEVSWLGASIKILPGGMITITSPSKISINSPANVSINGP